MFRSFQVSLTPGTSLRGPWGQLPPNMSCPHP